MPAGYYITLGAFAFIAIALFANVNRLLRVMKEKNPLEEMVGEDDDMAEEADEAPPLETLERPGRAGRKIAPLEIPIDLETTNTVLTHTDFDGVVSGAMLRHILGPNTNIMLSSPARIHRSLEFLAMKPLKPNRLFIADLGVRTAKLPDVESALIDIAEAGTKIYWYDHHPWSKSSVETIERDAEDVIVDRTASDAAAIIQKRLGSKSPYCEKLLRFVSNRLEPDEMEWGKQWQFLLMALQSKGSFAEREEAIVNLAENKELSFIDKRKVHQSEKDQEYTVKLARKSHRKETTASGKQFLVVDLRTFRVEEKDGKKKRVFDYHTVTSSIGWEIVKFQKPDFYILFYSNVRGSIRAGRNIPGLSFEPLQTLTKIKGKDCLIQGHGQASGVYLQLGMASKLKGMYNWSLPQEVENFIEEVKLRL
ncbi:MAG: hypothetical protein P9M00_04275 [Candidatus Tritonobacter lacicola]|nr:hypothetical protein [Candidatus Tritonobacter lacicola]